MNSRHTESPLWVPPAVCPDTVVPLKKTLANDLSITTCCLSDPFYTHYPQILMCQQSNSSNRFYLFNEITLIPTPSYLVLRSYDPDYKKNGNSENLFLFFFQ